MILMTFNRCFIYFAVGLFFLFASNVTPFTTSSSAVLPHPLPQSLIGASFIVKVVSATFLISPAWSPLRRRFLDPIKSSIHPPKSFAAEVLAVFSQARPRTGSSHSMNFHCLSSLDHSASTTKHFHPLYFYLPFSVVFFLPEVPAFFLPNLIVLWGGGGATPPLPCFVVSVVSCRYQVPLRLFPKLLFIQRFNFGVPEC